MAIQFVALEAVFEANAKPFKKATEECQVSSSSFIGTLGKIAAAIGAAFSVYKIEQFIKSSLILFSEYERAIAPLTFQLQNWTGGLKQFEFWSQQIATTTIYTKELALEMASLSMTMGVSQSDARQFTRIALDLASALKIDARTAVRLLADAYDGNTEALMRYSIALSTTKEGLVTIETLEKDLGKLHGQAAAEVTTLAGTYTQLTKEWSDYKQAIGEVLAPYAIKAMNIFRGLMYSMELDIGRGMSVWQSFLDTANLAMDGVFGKVGADTIRDYWRQIKEAVGVVGETLLKTWDDIKKAAMAAMEDWKKLKADYDAFMSHGKEPEYLRKGWYAENIYQPIKKAAIGIESGESYEEVIAKMKIGEETNPMMAGRYKEQFPSLVNQKTQENQVNAEIILNMYNANPSQFTGIDPRVLAAIVQALKQYGWAVASPTQNAGEITPEMTWSL